MTARYFRAMPAVYEAVRAQLDAAWGYPNAETNTQTAIPPASELTTDAEGRVYLAITAEQCEFILPSEILPQLIESGEVEEVSEAVYDATTSKPMGFAD